MKRRLIAALCLALFGLFPLLNSLGNPRLEAARPVDRLQLIASGMCFGAGIGVLFGGGKFRGQ